jgi:hypothetical protein
MDSLTIASSIKTPEIKFDAFSGKLSLSGRSIPENALEFYTPLFKWVDLYISNPNTLTTVEIKLEYFNTSSSKCLLQILKKLEHLLENKSSSIVINWYYEKDDEDMFEAGEDFNTVVGIPINIIEQ